LKLVGGITGEEHLKHRHRWEPVSPAVL
jgi:hypothetical protein